MGREQGQRGAGGRGSQGHGENTGFNPAAPIPPLRGSVGPAGCSCRAPLISSCHQEVVLQEGVSLPPACPLRLVCRGASAVAWWEAGRPWMSGVLSGRGRWSPELNPNDRQLDSASWCPGCQQPILMVHPMKQQGSHLMTGRLGPQKTDLQGRTPQEAGLGPCSKPWGLFRQAGGTVC